MTNGVWETPLGHVNVDSDLAIEIQGNADIIDIDDEAHMYEHSLEVQVPFLQYIFKDNIKIVPICMMMQDLDTSREVGEAVVKALRKTDAILIASSDMNHFESQKITEAKDLIALKAILNMDEDSLFQAIQSENISMCGYGPAIALIKGAKLSGIVKTKKLRYYTSGDITHDYESVVGYASILFTR
jgi:AmmeMemoRadiSam system protein B